MAGEKIVKKPCAKKAEGCVYYVYPNSKFCRNHRAPEEWEADQERLASDMSGMQDQLGAIVQMLQAADEEKLLRQKMDVEATSPSTADEARQITQENAYRVETKVVPNRRQRMYDLWQTEPQETIFIPIDPMLEARDPDNYIRGFTINGATYKVLVGQPVRVPKSIADVYMAQLKAAATSSKFSNIASTEGMNMESGQLHGGVTTDVLRQALALNQRRKL